MKRSTTAFSVVIPVRNENESLDELSAAIEKAVAPMEGGYEVLFIDDGSDDGTLDKLKLLALTDAHVRVFAFRRNLGKSTALEYGFQMARGDYIFTIDADLQDDPADLQPMYAHLMNAHADMVTGWRKERRDSLLKIVSSKLFNLVVVRMLFGIAFKDMNSGIKLYKAEVAKDLQLYGGRHRFIPLIAAELGYRVVELPVRHSERRYGSSKYRSTKILTEIPDLLTVFFLIKYTRQPLHFFGRIGSLLFGAGFVSLAYLTLLWTRGIPIGSRPLLSLGVLLVLVGGQTVFTGLLADLIVNMNQSRQKEFPVKYISDHDTAPER